MIYFQMILIALIAMTPPIFLDVAHKLGESFRPSIWWAQNKIRLGLAVLFIISMISLAFLAPDGEVEGISLAGLKSASGAVRLGIMATGAFLLFIKKNHEHNSHETSISAHLTPAS